ncbi:PD-(D/E)XK nuclease family protein [Flavobacteriaceae bacterium]|nr:PD-(D/E)XK nuclease family protein [Flavobacteriaceae bacterium]MDB9902109.1 PD-(D/E)XK nuclease family protein [Flavobacteriaceae bacterium]MDC0958037.1 PD-(D/E)XK nuclease family protein [Flavobacteriaceae bacterium]
MRSFLKKVINDIDFSKIDLKSICFVLPNKRASYEFKKSLSQIINKPVFVPQIDSIDSLIKKISGLKEIKKSYLENEIYQFYNQKKKISLKEQNYDINVVNAFLKDSSEIEQNLLKVEDVMSDLIELNKIKDWGENNLSTNIKKEFLKTIISLYGKFKLKLNGNGEGTKGMCYSEAVASLEHYKQANINRRFIFIGLNALSKAEEIIIKELIQINSGDVYWDIDSAAFKNHNHSASFHIRKYRKEWSFYSKNKFKWLNEDFNSKKKISIIEAQGDVGQVKEVGRILSDAKNCREGKTAVILGDENLINPVLQFFPKNLNEDDVDFSVPIKESGIKQLISALLDLKLEKNNYKSIKLIDEILCSNALRKTLGNKNQAITNHTLSNNTFITITESDKIFHSIVYKKWSGSNEILKELNNILKYLIYQGKLNEIEIQELNLILLELKEIGRLNGISSMNPSRLKQLIISFIKEISISYKSRKDSKINFMGLLESRALDFETVILTSVNEGIMPKGRSYESLLPYDLKSKYNLQTHNEKDRIYSYHFYRLIQRAKNIFLIYNSQEEGLKKAEKSRFIHQLVLEKNKNHTIEFHKTESNFENLQGIVCLKKTPNALKRIKEISLKGFSPSSLESYIKNPKEYYFQKLLNIKKEDDDESFASHKTIGLVFHETIELLYKPFIGKNLEIKALKDSLLNIDKVLKNTFVRNKEAFDSGKNLIIFEVIKSALKTFIQKELEDIKSGSVIKILALEHQIKSTLKLNQEAGVLVTGIIDRVDEKNGLVRIIDYKTGLVNSSNLTIKDMGLICKDPIRTKAMQLMCYAWMYYRSNNLKKISAGIISFRNLSNGLMALKIKDSKSDLIEGTSIDRFEEELKSLIKEIMDPEIDFIDSEI